MAPASKFAHLEPYEAQIVRLGILAERCFAEPPHSSLLKVRQIPERLVRLVASAIAKHTSRDEVQYARLRRLRDQCILPREIRELFRQVRRARNDANRALIGNQRGALTALCATTQLGSRPPRVLPTSRQHEPRRAGADA